MILTESLHFEVNLAPLIISLRFLKIINYFLLHVAYKMITLSPDCEDIPAVNVS